MYFNSINFIQNAGIWKNYRGENAPNFKAKNLIYGFNGSGKTTLSRIFSSIQNGQLDENLPRETTFKFSCNQNEEISDDLLIQRGQQSNVLVFNSDFVERNFGWGAEPNAKGIVYFGAGDKEDAERLSVQRDKLEKAQTELNGLNAEDSNAETQFNSLKTQIGRAVRDMLPTVTQTFNATQVVSNYAINEFDENDKLSDDDRKAKLAIALQNSPLAKISVNNIAFESILNWRNSCLSALKRSIKVSILDEFIKHSNALNWLDEGLEIHTYPKLDNCLFCGNELSNNRREQLSAVFDETWQKAIQEIDTLIDQGTALRNSLRELYRTLPKLNDFGEDHKDQYELFYGPFRTDIEALGLEFQKFLEILGTRKNNVVVDSDLSGVFNLEDAQCLINRLTEYQSTLIRIVDVHNSRVDDFANEKERAIEAIRKHVLAENQDEYRRLARLTATASENVSQKKSEISALMDTVNELRRKLSNHGIAAEKLNKLLAVYLGHNEISLQIKEEGGYQIVRKNSGLATHLSEGEKTALTFCYFIALLEADDRKIQDLTLVIDDPISSLDTSARTHAFSMLKRFTRDAKQLILLTHNAEFMFLALRWMTYFKTGNKKKAFEFFQLDCSLTGPDSRRETNLIKMDKLLSDYESEYNYMFSIVLRYSEQDNNLPYVLIPNAIRKVLEIFLRFLSPKQTDFRGLMQQHVDQLENKVDVVALEKLVQVESHAQIDAIVGFSVLTLEEGKRAAQAAMRLIQTLHSVHYDEMVAICNESRSNA